MRDSNAGLEGAECAPAAGSVTATNCYGLRKFLGKQELILALSMLRLQPWPPPQRIRLAPLVLAGEGRRIRARTMCGRARQRPALLIKDEAFQHLSILPAGAARLRCARSACAVSGSASVLSCLIVLITNCRPGQRGCFDPTSRGAFAFAAKLSLRVHSGKRRGGAHVSRISCRLSGAGG
jgi:hypothetical protein